MSTQKSQISSSQPGMGGTLGVIHSWEKFLPSCGFMKLENKLPIPEIQWWDSHRMAAIDVVISKRRKMREKQHWSQAVSESYQASSIRLQGLGVMLCGWRLQSLGLEFCPQNHFYFFLERSTCLHLSSLIRLFPVCRILLVWQLFFLRGVLYLCLSKRAIFC